MTKAILVIEKMPNCCRNCKFGLGYHCGAIYKNLLDSNYNSKPAWCPLKPIPKKKPISQDRGKNHCEYSLLDRLEYQKGFNDCIDEILREEE